MNCSLNDDELRAVLSLNCQEVGVHMAAWWQLARTIHSLLGCYNVKQFEVEGIEQEGLILCKSSPIK